MHKEASPERFRKAFKPQSKDQAFVEDAMKSIYELGAIAFCRDNQMMREVCQKVAVYAVPFRQAMLSVTALRSNLRVRCLRAPTGTKKELAADLADAIEAVLKINWLQERGIAYAPPATT